MLKIVKSEEYEIITRCEKHWLTDIVYLERNSSGRYTIRQEGQVKDPLFKYNVEPLLSLRSDEICMSSPYKLSGLQKQIEDITNISDYNLYWSTVYPHPDFLFNSKFLAIPYPFLGWFDSKEYNIEKLEPVLRQHPFVVDVSEVSPSYIQAYIMPDIVSYNQAIHRIVTEKSYVNPVETLEKVFSDAHTLGITECLL